MARNGSRRRPPRAVWMESSWWISRRRRNRGCGTSFEHVVQGTRGYLYVVARLGVTGRGSEDASVESLLRRCREITPVPRCLGFGMGLATPLERYRGLVEGVIVG